MSNPYQENLIKKVIDSSESLYWNDAVLEWEIADCKEDDESLSSCICGKENLRYLFTIQNTKNRNTLYPIGSSCIKKFERDDLNKSATIQEQLFMLYHAISESQFISLSPEFFSRKLLKHLLDCGAFKANEYNNYDPEKDYEFILKMFNKRNKNSITGAQQKKINAIIINSIRPYLAEQLLDKIKSKSK